MLTTLLGTFLMLQVAGGAAVQEPGKAGPPPTGPAVPAPVKPAPVEPAKKSLAGVVHRWVDVQTAIIQYRYRYIDTSRGLVTASQSQHSEGFRGRLKLDPKGKYSLNAFVQSGLTFISAWNNTGLGTGDAASNLYLKHLFLAARPTYYLEIQYGGIGVTRGETTEAIGYDNDAYLMGQRVSLKAPRKLFFDEVSATYAYLGDAAKPNINKRFYRLKESNYHQFLVSKRLSDRVAFTADYSFQSGLETLRQAVKVGTTGARFVDSVLFENYQRVDGPHPDYGCNIYGEKALHKRLSVRAGYASIDPYYNGLNGDKYNRGQRYYITLGMALTPEITVSPVFYRGFHNSYAIANRTRFDFVVSYNLLRGLQRAGLFKAPAAR